MNLFKDTKDEKAIGSVYPEEPVTPGKVSRAKSLRKKPRTLKTSSSVMTVTYSSTETAGSASSKSPGLKKSSLKSPRKVNKYGRYDGK